MNKSDALIGCNDTVCKWLRDNGYVGHNNRSIVESLQVFDFLSKSKSQEKEVVWPLRKIVYAGQLAPRKNRFLYDFGKYITGYTVNIYGRGFNKSSISNPEKFNVMGFMNYEELICCAEGDFGLVWDGDSVDVCNGNWGEYLMLNTPHKISLYIRSGLPILIWKNAAMAKFVKDNNIGICIDSLRDISNVFDSMTSERYNQMCNQVRKISELMYVGYYFSTVLSKVVLILEDKNA